MTSIGDLFNHFMELINFRFYNKQESDNRYVRKDAINVLLSEDGLLYFIFDDVTFDLTAVKTDYNVGGNVVLTVSIIDSDGSPLKNIFVTFKLVTGEILGSSITNNDGVAVFEFETVEKGVLKIKCENGSLSSNVLTVNIE